MARLIEVDDIETIPPRLTLSVGDVLRFTASGGRVSGGDAEVLQLLGSFLQGFLGPDARVISPQGPPTAVLFLARCAGRATIEVMTGDPFRGAGKATIEVVVA